MRTLSLQMAAHALNVPIEIIELSHTASNSSGSVCLSNDFHGGNALSERKAALEVE